MKPNRIRLIQYSAFSACFLALQQNARAQAVYSDIDPDIVLDENWESFGLDMNNDGIIDFGFLNRSFNFLTYYSNYSSRFEALYVGPQSPLNEIAALTHVISPSYGGFTVYFPFAIVSNETIDDGLGFHNNGYQTLAYRYATPDGFYFPYGGLWYPEVLDHFLGVRFIDTANCLHYGWIRCDVKEDGRVLVIKDYAYETKCETGIAAGDIIGDTSVSISEIPPLNGNIYSNGCDVFIQLYDIPNQCKVHIIDINGQEIYTSTIYSSTTSVCMINKPVGIYFVELFSGNQRIALKKISI